MAMVRSMGHPEGDFTAASAPNLPVLASLTRGEVLGEIAAVLPPRRQRRELTKAGGSAVRTLPPLGGGASAPTGSAAATGAAAQGSPVSKRPSFLSPVEG